MTTRLGSAGAALALLLLSGCATAAATPSAEPRACVGKLEDAFAQLPRYVVDFEPSSDPRDLAAKVLDSGGVVVRGTATEVVPGRVQSTDDETEPISRYLNLVVEVDDIVAGQLEGSGEVLIVEVPGNVAYDDGIDLGCDPEVLIYATPDRNGREMQYVDSRASLPEGETLYSYYPEGLYFSDGAGLILADELREFEGITLESFYPDAKRWPS